MVITPGTRMVELAAITSWRAPGTWTQWSLSPVFGWRGWFSKSTFRNHTYNGPSMGGRGDLVVSPNLLLLAASNCCAPFLWRA